MIEIPPPLLDAFAKWLANPVAAGFQALAPPAFVLSVNSWRRGRKQRKAPSFALRTIPMWWKGGYEGNRGGAGDGLPAEPPISRAVLQSMRRSVQALFPDEAVERIALTRVAFWNAGLETIRAADNPSANPIRLEPAPSGRILSSWIVSRTGKENHFDFRGDSTEVEILFDHVDHKEGMVLTVIHTGGALTVRGKVIGVRKMRLLSIEGEGRRLSTWIALGWIWTAGSAALTLLDWLFEARMEFASYIHTLVLLIAISWFPLLWRIIRRRVPFRLDSFEDDSPSSWDLPEAYWYQFSLQR